MEKAVTGRVELPEQIIGKSELSADGLFIGGGELVEPHGDSDNLA